MDVPGDLVLRNGGFFTRREALGWGETDRTLRESVRAGTLVRLRHGAYAVSAEHDQLKHDARHLVHARAARASQRGAVALTGPSAAIFHGYAVFGHDLDEVHLLRLGKSAARRQAGVVHHVQLTAETSRVEDHGGVLVVDRAYAAWETARLSSLEGAVVTLDAALHADPDLITALRALARAHSSHPGSRTARLALRLAREKSESPGESLTRVACFRHGIPEPDLQFDVYASSGRHLGRTDFHWPAHRHLAEFDGKIKYERLLRRGQTSSQVVVDEKAREDLMRGTGRGMTRMIWSGVQPGPAAARTMAGLAEDLQRSTRIYAGWQERSA